VYVLKLVQVLFFIMPLIRHVSAIFVAYTRKYAQVRDNIYIMWRRKTSRSSITMLVFLQLVDLCVEHSADRVLSSIVAIASAARADIGM
jgi:hypothetical protein